ncbi:MAG: hypothetical protein JWN04_2992 [Myxococcaceae bacterium]|nr:hypothetical protein [Myxococcaceae bacterium]
MVHSNHALSFALLGLLLGALACGDDDTSPSSTLDSSVPRLDAGTNVDSSVPRLDAGSVADATRADAGPEADADPNDESEVPCPPDFPQYSAGMTTTVGDLTVRLLSASPAPPRQLVQNNWLIELVHADQTPATDAIVANADSYMPVHRHHGSTQPVVLPDATAGRVQINAINFRMRGPWQVNFNVTPAGGTAAIATFQVCVQ